jgi:hypothetical protein
MRNTPHLLLWTDLPGPYIEAIRRAGLADRVTIDTVGRPASPDASSASRGRASGAAADDA